MSESKIKGFAKGIAKATGRVAGATLRGTGTAIGGVAKGIGIVLGALTNEAEKLANQPKGTAKKLHDAAQSVVKNMKESKLAANAGKLKTAFHAGKLALGGIVTVMTEAIALLDSVLFDNGILNTLEKKFAEFKGDTSKFKKWLKEHDRLGAYTIYYGTICMVFAFLWEAGLADQFGKGDETLTKKSQKIIKDLEKEVKDSEIGKKIIGPWMEDKKEDKKTTVQKEPAPNQNSGKKIEKQPTRTPQNEIKQNTANVDYSKMFGLKNNRLWINYKYIREMYIAKDNNGKYIEDFRQYTTKKGDTLSKIAKDRHMSVTELKKLNNLKSDKVIPGKTLTVRGPLKYKARPGYNISDLIPYRVAITNNEDYENVFLPGLVKSEGFEPFPYFLKQDRYLSQGAAMTWNYPLLPGESQDPKIFKLKYRTENVKQFIPLVGFLGGIRTYQDHLNQTKTFMADPAENVMNVFESIIFDTDLEGAYVDQQAAFDVASYQSRTKAKNAIKGCTDKNNPTKLSENEEQTKTAFGVGSCGKDDKDSRCQNDWETYMAKGNKKQCVVGQNTAGSEKLVYTNSNNFLEANKKQEGDLGDGQEFNVHFGRNSKPSERAELAKLMYHVQYPNESRFFMEESDFKLVKSIYNKYGQKWQDDIAKRIAHPKSPSVRREIELAWLRAQKHVIPFMLENPEFAYDHPKDISNLLLDWQTKTDKQYKEEIKTLQEKLTRWAKTKKQSGKRTGQILSREEMMLQARLSHDF